MAEQTTLSIIGNCQTEILAKFVRVLRPDIKVHRFSYADAITEANRSGKEEILGASDFVFSNPFRGKQFGKFSFEWLQERPGSHFFQPFSFAGFQPDCVYLGLAKAIPRSSPVGDYSSSIAVFAFLQGASVAETVQLYNDTVYQKLGFYDVWTQHKRALLKNNRTLGLELAADFDLWEMHGLFMHTINHPYSFVVRDIARRLLTKAGIAAPDIDPVKFVSDRGADDIVWPVYPEIAERLGIHGEMVFKSSDRWADREEQPKIYDLESFVAGSFAIYDKMKREDLVCRSIAMSHQRSVEVVGELLSHYRREGARAFARSRADRERKHPYADLPAHQFWRKGVAEVAMADVDPVVSMPFRLAPADRVATAGSCFAQHIAARLVRQGFNYLVTEKAPDTLDAAAAKARNFGVFTARFGNIYTTRQLLQLIERAHGRFTPVDSVWLRPGGGFVDPFRPQIEPEGFPSVAALERDRTAHFAAVRAMFEQADLFVFTLGLTEGWRSRKDGAVFPLAPGVAGGVFDTEAYEFVNFTAEEVTSDLIAAIERIRVINPRCRVLLTVSPVPLIATYEPRHVLVSTTYSKSVLRVAAEQACRALDRVHYFPSYEIITGGFAKGEYYEDDLRSIRSEGVDHVMRLLFHHMTEASEPRPTATPVRENQDTENGDFAQRMTKLDEVVCDEEALDR